MLAQEIQKKLSTFKISENNDVLISNSDYVWKNTIDRTKQKDFQNQIDRFSDKVNTLTNILSDLVDTNKLSKNFTILELFCGNGIVLYTVKKKFPDCISVGLDLLKFDMWTDINSEFPDIQFIQSNFFDIYNSGIDLNLDVMITYNTWRGWDNSVGPNSKVSKDNFMTWAMKNFKYIIADNTIIV